MSAGAGSREGSHVPGIAIVDPAICDEQVAAIRAALPAGWSLLDGPAGATAILTENVDVTLQMLHQAGPGLRLVARLDTGTAAVAPTSAVVADLSNTGLVGVAEHAVTLMLALSRNLLWVARRTAAQQWAPGRDQPVLTDQRRYTYNWIGLEGSGCLYRKVVGIVGLGHIGRAVAARLRPFGVRLLYTDIVRLAPVEEARLGVCWRELDDLLRESDFVTLHHRFREGPGGNDRQFGAREYALMKPTAYFINTARGRLVDEDALADALRRGQIAGAGIDVFRYEPPRPDNPLVALAGDNVILTAHTAGAPMAEAWQTTAHELIERIQDLV
jgi:phosphoglycerate dehydrogenase-like enzyme